MRYSFSILFTILLTLLPLNGRTKDLIARQYHCEVRLGNENAPVKIIEYASLSCEHCAQFHNEVMPRIKADFIDTGKIYYVFRHYPMDPASLEGAQIVGVGADQQKRHQILAALFKKQEQLLGKKRHKVIQDAAGLETNKLEQCLKNRTWRRDVLAQRLEAEQNFHINGTPAFVINGQVHIGALTYEEFESIINNISHTKNK